MAIPLPNKASYTEVTLVILLSLIAGSDSKAESAELESEFYNRVAAKFYDNCHKMVFKLYSTQPDWEFIRDDIIQESYIVAFEKLPDFETKEHWSDKECMKVILYWMNRIANNILIKQINKNTEEGKHLEQYTYHVESENSDGVTGRREVNYTYDRVKVIQLMKDLNPMAKEIMFACMKHGTLNEENTKHLPDDVTQALKLKYKVSAAAIRKAKQRTIESIISCKL